jgi:hypothetical protein
MRKISSITVTREGGEEEIFAVDKSVYICILEIEDINRVIALTGSTEKQVVMLKILDSIITKRLLDNNVILTPCP